MASQTNIRHKFNVSKTQSSDPTIVRNNDWNDQHYVIVDEVDIFWQPSTGHNHDGLNSRIAQKANQLATPRTINGVVFDGTTNITLTPANLGLDNVDNTHDAIKHVSFADTAGSAPTVVTTNIIDPSLRASSTVVRNNTGKNLIVIVSMSGGVENFGAYATFQTSIDSINWVGVAFSSLVNTGSVAMFIAPPTYYYRWLQGGPYVPSISYWAEYTI